MARGMTQLLFVSIFTASVLSAQSSSGYVVNGTVLDPHTAGVLGAKVTFRRAGGSEKYQTRLQSATADSKGAFRFEEVPSGKYEIQIEQEGFKPSITPLQVGNQAPRALTMARLRRSGS